MSQTISFHYDVPGDDFTRAGEASSSIKKALKQVDWRRISSEM